MSIQTLTGIPRQIEAGSTCLFTEQFTSYPVGTWTAALLINMADRPPIRFDATTSGTSFLFTLPATLTAGIAPAIYEFAIYVFSSGQRANAKTGTITVLPDLTQDQAPTMAETMVATLTKALAMLAATSNSSVSFNGQTFTKARILEYRQEIVFWQAQVISNNNKLAAQRGAGDPGRIKTQFHPTYDGAFRYNYPFGPVCP